jgi:aminoglycoside/choline kinase family phosphotransferase
MRSGLLLEDLGGLDVADQLVGVGPDRAGLAVEHLARAHAQWWHNPRLRVLTWMPSFGDDVVKQVAGLCRQLWQPFLALHGAGLPDRAVRLGHRVVDRLEKLLDDVSRPPVTIVHGDFRLDNLFFGAASKHDAVAAVDWQLACRGKGAFDVAYLLGQSMPVEARRRHEMAVLRRWHDGLVRGGVSGYSFDAAVADYRRCALVCVAWAVAGTALERADERGRLLARAQVVQSFAAAVDLEADVFLTQ